MFKHHQDLIGDRKNQKFYQEEFKKVEERLQKYRTREQELERHVGRFNARTKALELVELCKKQRHWAVFGKLQNNAKVLKEEKEKKEAELNNLNRNQEPNKRRIV